MARNGHIYGFFISGCAQMGGGRILEGTDRKVEPDMAHRSNLGSITITCILSIIPMYIRIKWESSLDT